MVFGEDEAGRLGGGACETIVVRREAKSSVVDRVVGERSFPGTEG